MELVLNKAQSLFFCYGVKSISMDDIAKEAGVSKKTIYQSFVNKTDVVNRVVRKFIQFHQLAIEQCKLTAKDVVDEVLNSATVPFYTISCINQNFFYELKRFFPDEWELLINHRENVLVPSIKENLEAGIQTGYYRSDLNVTFTTDVRVQQILTALNPKEFNYTTVDGNKVMLQLSELFLHAIVTEKGKKLISKYLKKDHETSL